jgi:polysaccharide export outer membrane protein
LDVPEYSAEYQVPPGGRLYVPLIGSVSVQGLTQEQAADRLAGRYSRYLKRPLVTVILTAARPINVNVAGEVNRPGSFAVALQSGGGNDPGVQYPTLASALALAQGVTLSADVSQVQIRRRLGVNGQQNLTVDLRQLAQTGDLSVDTTLRDGDTIFVPTVTSINLGETRQLAEASFAADPNKPRTVTVVGEVNRPGPYVVIGGATTGNTQLAQGGTITTQGTVNTTGFPTVTRAIQLAGGITPLADIRNIRIRRPTKTGTEQLIGVNLWKLLQQGDVNQDTIVQDGDSIVVPTAVDVNPAEATQLATANFSPDTIQVSVVGEVKTPGLVKLPPNTPMNQAILTAGGFNNSRAFKKNVELIRLNPDGTATRSVLPVDFAQGINDKTNPTLRNNDIIVVARSDLARAGDTIGTVTAPLLSILGLIGVFGI